MAKKNRIKDAFLAELRKVPIVAVAAEKVNVSRNSVYTWRKEDGGFRNEMDTALAEGEALITDMSESQLLSLIQDKNFPSIQLWLKAHHPKYGNKLEIAAKVRVDQPLTPEQEETIKKAINALALPPIEDDDAKES